MAIDRVVILWFDDVHWGADSMEFVQALYQRAEGAFLVIMTARDEALKERPIERDLIDVLAQHDTVDVHEMGPLPPDDHATLVRGLLCLEPSLAQRVEARTKGNPRFAIQMVRDWVLRAALIAGPDGFMLSPQASGELPVSVDQVWQRRVEARLDGYGVADVQALELAAVLGMEVSRDEWRDLCRFADVAPSDGLVSGLLPDRMIEVLDPKKAQGDWRFAHASIRRTLEQSARRAGRLIGHHLLCARMLRSRGEWGARLGHHLRAGGATADALGPLQRSLDDHLRMGDRLGAEGILREYRSALDELSVPAGDPRRLTSRLFESRIAALHGDLVGADDLAFEVEVSAQEHGWDELETAALGHRARVAYFSGQLTDAKRLTGRAIEQLDARGDLRRLADCHWLLGRICRSQGAFPEARDSLEYAESAFRALGLVVEAAECLLELARIARQRDEQQPAKLLIESARGQLQRAGARASEAAAVHDLGEIARLEGNLADAEAHYRQARLMFTAVGSAHAVYAELNLAAVLQARGAYAEARVLLDGSLETAVRQGRRVFVAAVRVILLPCCAHFGDWAAWDVHLEQAKQTLDETGYVEVDLAHHAYVGAFIAADAGERARAIDGLRLAVRQWKALYRSEEVKAALARIADLEGES
jgi:tetratricopeptide (TPR) repeat protein